MSNQRIIEAFKRIQPRQEMDEDEVKLFMNIITSKDPNLNKEVKDVDKNSVIYKHFEPMIKAFQFKILLSRLNNLTTLRITLGAFILLALRVGTAGHAVMLAFYMHNKLPKNTLITTEVFSQELFPWGLFTDEQLNEIWDIQKVEPEDGLDESTCIGAHDNLLDYLETWKKD